MSIQSINPATGERLREFSPLSASEIELRVRRADQARARWARTSIQERTRIVARAGEILDAEQAAFGRLMTLEMGKPIRAAREEAAKCALACRYYAEHAAEFLANQLVDMQGETGYVAFQPLGVVLAIMPWNFPFWQVMRFAAPALCAGNIGLLKHASNVPQCALALEDLFRRAGAPEGTFQALLVGSGAIPGILADPRVVAATLTGSEHAGSEVAAAAGKHIKKTVLELGGSDPFVVMPSADLDATVRVAVKARVINNGQSCIAAKRFIVHEQIAEEFERRFAARMRELVVGDPMDEHTDVGPLATAQIRDDLHRQVESSVRLGACVLTGGQPRPGAGFYYEPTVLTQIPAGSPAHDEELFGPVASVFRARDLDDAIRIANDTRFGLGASAWTREGAEARRFADELEAGSVFINGMVASDPRFPFGGVKISGYGRELSAFGIHEFVNVKTVRMTLGETMGAHATE
ncbi:MAG TPA: NAD-dependent succinate-semialdehyde dehydrogenase [Gemmatimonadaceae bacterium]|nr:NAD-dependent succinate-semialdehyde dehydrogenase [Gemmatimonadaceae bacterium]